MKPEKFINLLVFLVATGMWFGVSAAMPAGSSWVQIF